MTRDNPPVSTVSGLLLAGMMGLLIWVLFRQLGAMVPLLGSLVVLWPLRREPWARSLLILLAFFGALWILHQARMVVYPLLGGLLAAYWLDPIVDRLARRGVPRSVGALVALLPALAVGAVFVLFVLPALIDQLTQLVGVIPGVYRSIYEAAVPWLSRLLPDGAAPGAARDWLGGVLPDVSTVLEAARASIGGVTKGVGAVLAFLGMVVLAPILTYYLLADFDRMIAWIDSQIPTERQEQTHRILRDIEETVRAYFRGQVLVALIVGSLLTIGFLIIGMPYPFLLGFLGGLLNLVPILGFWVSVVLFVPAAFLAPEPLSMLVRLAIVLAAESFLESQAITPRIIGKTVGLNPALVLISVLVAAAVLGPVGVLIGVPAAAFGRTLILRRQASRAATPPVPAA